MTIICLVEVLVLLFSVVIAALTMVRLFYCNLYSLRLTIIGAVLGGQVHALIP